MTPPKQFTFRFYFRQNPRWWRVVPPQGRSQEFATGAKEGTGGRPGAEWGSGAKPPEAEDKS